MGVNRGSSSVSGLNKPFVIAINANGGGGKTALTTHLHKSLPDSALLAYDDFDATNAAPDDWYEWLQRGADIVAFDCPGFAQAVAEEIERGAVPYVILDYPFGREHPRLRDFIDLSVFIDTPLDVAFARRLLRDYGADSGARASELQALRKHARHYLQGDRELFIYHSDLHQPKSDMVLNGCRSLDELRDQLLARIHETRHGRSV